MYYVTVCCCAKILRESTHKVKAVCNRWTGLLDWTTGLTFDRGLWAHAQETRESRRAMSGSSHLSPVSVKDADSSPIIVEIEDSPVKLVVSPVFK